MDRLLSLWNVKVDEVRLVWRGSFGALTSKHLYKKPKTNKTTPPPKKKQISDMQTSTLSRNKYTKSWGKASGGLPAFQSRYTDTWFQQYGHTDIVGQGHFIKHLIRNERCYWSRGVGCICFLPRHMKKWSVLKFACQKKKKKKIQQLQSVHSLPENIQNLTKKKKKA